ncbi:MAG TPA: DUF2752 domain-containing protein [Acidimicrobiales bacterium]|nr:DUF2752 domain-containing protein [Acidimicrobiales bacterium]
MLAALEVGLPCVLKQTTGVDCPLCGATRATFALLRGDVGEALDLNALYVLLLPALLTVAALWLMRRSRPALLSWRRLPSVALAVAVAYMALRNLPFAPFDYLGA